MRFTPLTPTIFNQWNRVICDSDDAWLYHQANWLQATEKIWNLESRSFAVEHNEKVIAIFPLQMDRRTMSLKSSCWGAGGAASINSLDAAFRRKMMEAIYRHAEEIARESRATSIEVSLPSLARSSLDNRWGVNPLVNYRYEDASTHTFVADLAQSEKDIHALLSKDARQRVRKAIRGGYRVEQMRSLNDIDEYYRVHCATYRRTGATPHPKAYFEAIYTHMCSKGHAVIWKALAPGGTPVAFEIIGRFKDGAVYWAGCCETEHLDSGVNYLLQYNSMISAKRWGAMWFENGEAFPTARDGKLRGLSIFKGKFGGELHRFYKGKIALTTRKTRAKAIENRLRRTASRLALSRGIDRSAL